MYCRKAAPMTDQDPIYYPFIFSSKMTAVTLQLLQQLQFGRTQNPIVKFANHPFQKVLKRL